MTTIKQLAEIARGNPGYKACPEIFQAVISHQEDVAALTKNLANALGYKSNLINSLETAALLHDVGKLWMTVEELLDETKYYPSNNPIRGKHVQLGLGIAKQYRWNPLICNVIGSHHESYDKPEWGYPGKQQGEDIPEMVRVVTIADAFCALKEDRPYRLGMSFEKIKAIMTNHNHEKFDQKLVNILFENVLIKNTKQPADFTEAYYS